jgi:tetratricopeptide (TPR) repeat protein
MDEQRQAEYISLINQLLTCPSGQELAILNNNSTLVDAGFVQMLRSVSNLLLEQGRKDAADFLMNIAEQLIRVIQAQSSTSSASTFSNQNSQYVFFQVLLQTAWSNPSSESVYPLLTDNLDKLDNHFIVLLQRWSNASISNLNESIKPDVIAGFIGTLGDLFRDFPLGDKAINIEIAIAAYEIAANIFTVEAFPDYWAMLQNSLGKSYLERVVGTRRENVEQALTIHTIIVSPESWAMLQSNLGAAHLERINGDKIDNFEKAITFFNQALTVFSPTNFPEYWAYTHNNLGEAYRDRIFGNKADNLEQAIAHCNQAIPIFNRNDFPQQWAIVQNNLGNTYSLLSTSPARVHSS